MRRAVVRVCRHVDASLGPDHSRRSGTTPLHHRSSHVCDCAGTKLASSRVPIFAVSGCCFAIIGTPSIWCPVNDFLSDGVASGLEPCTSRPDRAGRACARPRRSRHRSPAGEAALVGSPTDRLSRDRARHQRPERGRPPRRAAGAAVTVNADPTGTDSSSHQQRRSGPGLGCRPRGWRSADHGLGRCCWRSSWTSCQTSRAA